MHLRPSPLEDAQIGRGAGDCMAEGWDAQESHGCGFAMRRGLPVDFLSLIDGGSLAARDLPQRDAEVVVGIQVLYLHLLFITVLSNQAFKLPGLILFAEFRSQPTRCKNMRMRCSRYDNSGKGL